MRTIVGRHGFIVAGIICIVLTATLIGAIVNYTSIISVNENTIATKDAAIRNLNAQITTKNFELAEKNNTISSLNSQISDKNSQIETLVNQNNQLQNWLAENITAFNAQIAEMQTQVNASNSKVEALQNQASADRSTIAFLQNQVESSNYQINALNSTIITLQSQINDLTAIINIDKTDLAGISVHALSENEARLVSESGAGWIRIDAYDGFEEAVINAKAYNLSVLGILDCWMFTNKSSVFTLEEWQNSVTYYVSRYADYVDAWEIWNEPANPRYPLLNLNVSDPENLTKAAQFYFSMAQTAEPIIRQYDPTAEIVLFGGLNLNSGADSHLTLDKQFASQLAAMGIQQYGDAISVHVYPWTHTVSAAVWEKYSDAIDYYHALFPSLNVWLTETGHPADFDGEEGQTRYMADSLNYFNAKVSHLFWYSLQDNSWETDCFGLIRPDGTPRLAYYELQKQCT